MLDEQVAIKMKNEYTRLQQEEQTRVQAYTAKWQSHVEKVTIDKDADRDRKLEE